MDCNKAEEAMMRYMEKTIKPSEAKSLALHLLKCESCREYFTALDMTMEALDEGEVMFAEAPAGFTEAVMEKVNELPAYREKKKKVRNYDFAIRLTGGLCAVLTGLVLVITSWLAPAGTVDSVLGSINQWFGRIAADLTQNGFGSFFRTALLSAPNLGLTALAIAAVVSVLLFTLQRGDNVKA